VEFAVDDDREVAAIFEKLHDFDALAGQDGPAGFGVGILFEGAEVAAVEAEVDLLQFLFGGGAHREGVAGNRDGARVLDHGLVEDSEQRGFEVGWGHGWRV